MVLTLIVGVTVSEVKAGQAGAGFSIGVSIVKKGAKPRPPKFRRAVRYTVAAASMSVLALKFRVVQMVGRDPETYWFTAEKSGRFYSLAVSQRTGQVLKIVRMV